MTSDSPALAAEYPAIHAAVLEWYAAHGRRLAFRATQDPWAILVSEAMAQQTQAERAAEAWTRFMTEFPTVEAVADATPAAVLRAWRGLGYNRRALALRAAAQQIVAHHGGRVPADVAALRSLPGVGPYTARAVAALAFGQAQAAVDTNVARVLGRALGGTGGVEAVDRAALQRLADSALPEIDPAAWTHALMDIGATLCRIRAPRCDACPLQPWCGFASAEAAARAKAAASATAAAGPAAVEGAEDSVPTNVPAPADARADAPADARAGRSPRRARGTRTTGPRPRTPFPGTTRWLRGRILDRLRDAPGDGWLAIDGPLGSHDRGAVAAAIKALAAERLLEVRRTDTSLEARLPEA